MTYNNNVPISGQSLDETRDPIRGNFQLIKSGFDQDHVDFDDANAGKHQYVRYTTHATGPETAADISCTFTKDVTYDGNTVPQLFWRPESQGTGQDAYQLTTSITSDFATFGNSTAYDGANNGGWTFLPGGLIMQYGNITAVGGASPIPFPIEFVAAPYTVNFNVLFTGSPSAAMAIRFTAVSNTEFSLNLTGCPKISATTIYWTAIGK